MQKSLYQHLLTLMSVSILLVNSQEGPSFTFFYLLHFAQVQNAQFWKLALCDTTKGTDTRLVTTSLGKRLFCHLRAPHGHFAFGSFQTGGRSDQTKLNMLFSVNELGEAAPLESGIKDKYLKIDTI